MRNMPLRIMTRDFQLLDEVDLYSSLQITRSWHGIGSIDLAINRYIKGADKLQRDCIIFPHNHLDKGFIIKHKEIELDENGKATENWLIKAQSLKAWFLDRLTMPPEGKSQDAITADAETVMRHYVTNNVVNPQDINDKLTDIITSDNLNRGQSIEWQSRYKVLAEELAEIGLLTGLGWNIEIDYTNKKYVFKVLEGRDLTVNQSDNPPAIFSPEFGTLQQLSYVESELDYKNYAVVAGQGEGADRRIVTVGDAVGADRRVLFVDARDVEEETDDDPPKPIPVEQIEQRLRNRGMQKLAEHEQEIYLEGQVAMGRVVEKVPKVVDGVVEDLRLDEVDLWGDGRNLRTLTNPVLRNSVATEVTQVNEHVFFGIESYKFTALTSALKYIRLTPVISFVQDEIYTFSLYLYGDASKVSNFIFYDVATHEVLKRTTVDVGNGYYYLSLTFSPTRTGVPTHGVLLYSNMDVGESLFVSGLKLEKGTTPTPWQPAPEDGIPWYQPTKTINLGPINLNKLGRYKSSRFTFSTNTPPKTSATVEYSLDNQTWHKLQSGDALPLNEGDWLTNTTLYLRQRLSTTGQAVTPSITGFEYEIKGYHEREKISTARLEYQKDYDLGDMATLQNKEWGVTLDARITEVKEIYEPGKTVIEPTFGNNRPTLISKIKQEMSGINAEITR